MTEHEINVAYERHLEEAWENYGEPREEIDEYEKEEGRWEQLNER